VGGGFSNGCFLAAARDLMPHLVKGKTQKHQNRPKENFFFFLFRPLQFFIF